MLKVYLDESGIHDDSPVIVVAAYLARPRQWAAFTKNWTRTICPAKIYHATDAANLRGEFSTWTKQEVTVVAARSIPVIVQHVEFGLAVGIQMDDFRSALAGRKVLLDLLGTPYSACLYWLMATILREKASRQNSERIAFYHEVNSYKSQALEVFTQMKEQYNPQGSKMSFTFGAKEEYVPLQAADVLAYEANKRLRNIGSPDRKALQALHQRPERLQIKFFDRVNLPWLVAQLESHLPSADSVFGPPG